MCCDAITDSALQEDPTAQHMVRRTCRLSRAAFLFGAVSVHAHPIDCFCEPTPVVSDLIYDETDGTQPTVSSERSRHHFAPQLLTHQRQGAKQRDGPATELGDTGSVAVECRRYRVN